MPYRKHRVQRPRVKRRRTSEEPTEDAGQQQQPEAGPAENTASPSAESSTRRRASNSATDHDAGTLDHPDATSSPASAEATAANWVGPLIGYCFCRDWKVTIKEPIPGVVVCHCKDCQAISSSFFCTFLTVSMGCPTPQLLLMFALSLQAGCITESLEGALPVNRNLFVGPHNNPSPALQELLTPRIEIFTKDRSQWRPEQEGVLHQYVSMPVGFGDSGNSDDAEANPAILAGDLHL
ncbi:hypothetical protein AOL_s00007g78 [Orbilia oligospora ATCC 24927]|uniref:CENP-V/GFA domain-containing protein n=1 Tax=Arthrobotrys oligospora (strain ATCC 24927 / CBS 115.81 / DSM 1491) TaxID=756982 RepID=G1X1B9_ARTOA|nr:hypothetical protein AOL_s00007g78 [Orbilia oligospora ATCC 24927]EGX53129.1 hypothetical protein AOL_s00007g78 [Orbilia oligospora ATCC 24927]